MYAAYLNYASELVRSASGFTASTQATGYPAANVGVLPISNPWRTTSPSSQYIEIDLGASQNFNLLAILNHNLTAAATITIAAGNVANPSTYTDTIPWRQYDAFLLLAVTKTFRYVRITINDSGNPDGFLSLGAVFIGVAPTLDFGFNFGWQFSDLENNVVVQTEYNVTHAAALNYQVGFQFQFDQLTTAQAQVLRAIFLAAQQNVFPLFWIPDAGVNDGYCVRFNGTFTRVMNLRASAQIAFTEESRGQAISA